jgi:hypothetical protein
VEARKCLTIKNPHLRGDLSPKEIGGLTETLLRMEDGAEIDRTTITTRLFHEQKIDTHPSNTITIVRTMHLLPLQHCQRKVQSLIVCKCCSRIRPKKYQTRFVATKKSHDQQFLILLYSARRVECLPWGFKLSQRCAKLKFNSSTKHLSYIQCSSVGTQFLGLSGNSRLVSTCNEFGVCFDHAK